MRRFIPACAGNAIAWDAPRFERRFIPACAGNACPVHEPARDPGSSPRVRGTPSDRRHPDSRTPVHPRVCGERGRAAASLSASSGSSPRVRGTRDLRGLLSGDLRFIPACAGNASLRRRHYEQAKRFIPACAGNAVLAVVRDLQERGSSPRVRGTPGRGSRRRSDPTVHPRVCGERSFQKRLILKILHDVKQRTGVLSMFQAPRQGGYFHWCADLHGDRRPNIQNIDRDRFCSNTA